MCSVWPGGGRKERALRPSRFTKSERERESVGGEKSLLFLGEPHFLFFQDSPEGMVASVVVMVVATEVSLFFPALLVPFPLFLFFYSSFLICVQILFLFQAMVASQALVFLLCLFVCLPFFVSFAFISLYVEGAPWRPVLFKGQGAPSLLRSMFS